LGERAYCISENFSQKIGKILDFTQYIVIYYWRIGMATNLAIDDNLLKTALVIGGLKTKKDTVNMALDEFIQRRKRQEVIDLFGKIEFDTTYDYKKSRGKR
jgi:Arc/MetJ family transcription regulator